jgi:hypothetical protein
MLQSKGGAQRKSTRVVLLERRAFVRYGADLEVPCQPSGSMRNAGWLAKVANISAGGIALLLHHRFEPGSPLTIEVQNRTGTFRRTVVGKVVHANAVCVRGEHYWLLGCTFAEELSPEEVKALR